MGNSAGEQPFSQAKSDECFATFQNGKETGQLTFRVCNKTLPIWYTFRESHLTVTPRVYRSLRVVSLVLKFANYALSSGIDWFINSATIEPFFDYHRELPRQQVASVREKKISDGLT